MTTQQGTSSPREFPGGALRERKRRATLLVLTVLAIALLPLISFEGCSKSEVSEPQKEIPADVYAGGATTVFVEGSNAYSMPAPNLAGPTLASHQKGKSEFVRTFVPEPDSIDGGLGPLFNNSSCVSCHPGNGRGRPPFYSPEELTSMLIRISDPGTDMHGGPNPVPGFGIQLQQRCLNGLVAEGVVSVHWTEIPGAYPDSTPYSLRKTFLVITGRLPSSVLTSPRMAPPIFGAGLLEAVEDATILAMADESDANGDGISGRANGVWDESLQTMRLGRFGWKAGQPTILQQNALAYNQDIGVTNPYYPQENCFGTSSCDTLNDDPEISSAKVSDVTLFTQTLGVPARRNYEDNLVTKGKGLFERVGCNGCHVEQLKTGPHALVTELSGQTIFPYTDLLLHDMGEGLSDDRPEYQASGAEWRTAPLWGIGQTALVEGGYAFYLHDGRARSLEEAILWHGGEGLKSRDAFRSLPSSDRSALLKFLQSL